jgi:hypothetical protein
MKKMLGRLALLTLLGSSVFNASAQSASRPAPTVTELKKKLVAIGEGNEETIGELADETALRLTAFLKTHELSAAQATEIGLETPVAAGDGHFKVYTIGYASGGTRGTVHIPVLQWKSAAGHLGAYRLHEECDFTEVHKLASPGRTLYLLLGQEEGDMNAMKSEALVVELKGNYLLLYKAAFGNYAPLVLHNVELSFNDHQQVLKLDLADHDADEEDDKVLAQWGYHGKFPKRPLTLFRRTYPPEIAHKKSAAKTLNLKFSGGRFAKSS